MEVGDAELGGGVAEQEVVAGVVAGDGERGASVGAEWLRRVGAGGGGGGRGGLGELGAEAAPAVAEAVGGVTGAAALHEVGEGVADGLHLRGSGDVLKGVGEGHVDVRQYRERAATEQCLGQGGDERRGGDG